MTRDSQRNCVTNVPLDRPVGAGRVTVLHGESQVYVMRAATSPNGRRRCDRVTKDEWRARLANHIFLAHINSESAARRETTILTASTVVAARRKERGATSSTGITAKATWKTRENGVMWTLSVAIQGAWAEGSGFSDTDTSPALSYPDINGMLGKQPTLYFTAGIPSDVKHPRRQYDCRPEKRESRVQASKAGGRRTPLSASTRVSIKTTLVKSTEVTDTRRNWWLASERAARYDEGGVLPGWETSFETAAQLESIGGHRTTSKGRRRGGGQRRRGKTTAGSREATSGNSGDSGSNQARVGESRDNARKQKGREGQRDERQSRNREARAEESHGRDGIRRDKKTYVYSFCGPADKAEPFPRLREVISSIHVASVLFDTSSHRINRPGPTTTWRSSDTL
ncbi:hypothetical protein DFH06DRAFT_1152695 [Mycena polygramma]|nr:hypothetical protein DFH06DRAFT_1152695 [Mycena polygramma]